MPILRRTQYTGRRPAYKAPPTTLEGMIIQWISEANCGVRAFLPDHERTTLTEDDEPACHLYVRDQRQIGRHTSRTHPKEHDLTITRVQYEADVQLRFQGAGAEAAARAFRLWMNTADAREKENQLGFRHNYHVREYKAAETVPTTDAYFREAVCLDVMLQFCVDDHRETGYFNFADLEFNLSAGVIIQQTADITES